LQILRAVYFVEHLRALSRLGEMSLVMSVIKLAENRTDRHLQDNRNITTQYDQPQLTAAS